MIPKVVSTEDLTSRPTRKSPVTHMLEQVDGIENYKRMRDVAEHFGVHVETIRRLSHARDADGKKRVNAPSKAMVHGEMVVYLFTEEDIKELEAYFARRGSRRKKEKE